MTKDEANALLVDVKRAGWHRSHVQQVTDNQFGFAVLVTIRETADLASPGAPPSKVVVNLFTPDQGASFVRELRK